MESAFSKYYFYLQVKLVKTLYGNKKVGGGGGGGEIKFIEHFVHSAKWRFVAVYLLWIWDNYRW